MRIGRINEIERNELKKELWQKQRCILGYNNWDRDIINYTFREIDKGVNVLTKIRTNTFIPRMNRENSLLDMLRTGRKISL